MKNKRKEFDESKPEELTKYQKDYLKRKARRSEAKKLNDCIKIGETYGNYKVLEKIKVPKKISRGNGIYVDCMATAWRCLCLKDNLEKIVKTEYLQEFKTKDQKQLEVQKLVEQNKHQLGFRNYLYRGYRKNASIRKHKFNLTQDEFESIITKNCYYCGEPPRPMTEYQILTRGNSTQPPYYYNGIDRLDHSKDYDIENCVPCCPDCNYMKHIFTSKQFFSRIVRIYNHLNLGSETIPIGSTPQTNGGGSGGPLTGNAEGEDIVQSA